MQTDHVRCQNRKYSAIDHRPTPPVPIASRVVVQFCTSWACDPVCPAFCWSHRNTQSSCAHDSLLWVLLVQFALQLIMFMSTWAGKMWPTQDSQNQNVLPEPQDTSRWDPVISPRTKKNPAIVSAHLAPADTWAWLHHQLWHFLQWLCLRTAQPFFSNQFVTASPVTFIENTIVSDVKVIAKTLSITYVL